MPEPYFPFTLRLYAHTLHCLGDHNFTGLDLFYRIKDCWKGRDQPNDLLMRPLEPGLSHKIGEWCFDTLFDVEGDSESADKMYIKTLQPEDSIWFVGDVCEAARLSSFFGDAEPLKAMAARVRKIDDLYETDVLLLTWRKSEETCSDGAASNFPATHPKPYFMIGQKLDTVF